MLDLRTNYMGLELAHPLVASASPLTKDAGGVRRLEDAGAAAVVMFSLFEEQIRNEQEAVEHLSTLGADSHAESLGYFPPVDGFKVGPDRYLELIRRARESVKIPIIASLNGVTNEGWIDFAREVHQAGASAIELNAYIVPANLSTSGRDVEQLYVDILKHVKAAVPIPVAMKLSPYFSAFGNMAKQLDDAGADGLVLFNRFYQPDVDLDRLEIVPSLELSTPSELRLPLLWIAVLYGRIKASLAASTGVHSGAQALKLLLAGADIVMATSALLKHGPGHLRTMLAELRTWLEQRRITSVGQIRGAMSQERVADPAAFERANYLRILQSYKNPYGRG